jgi:hypothetical protein
MRLGFLILWIAFLVWAFPYVRRNRHPSARPLAAYLVFITLFSLCTAALFLALTWLLAGLDRTNWLNHPVGAGVFLALVFVPAFLVARWQLHRPPRQPRTPPD